MPLVEYIKGKFPGLNITTIPTSTGVKPIFIYRSANTLVNPFEAPDAYLPYVYINESLASFDCVADMNLNEIALIRFIPPPVLFAPYNGGDVGALMIYTKNNVDESKNLPGKEQFDNYTFNGYTFTREFSSPDYSIPINKSLPDRRTTLYWQPELKTDLTGHARFNFYNSDVTKGYVVLIQGMDGNGHTGCIYKIIHQ